MTVGNLTGGVLAFVLAAGLVACGDRAGTDRDDSTALGSTDTTATAGTVAGDTLTSPVSEIHAMNDSNIVAKLGMMDSMEISHGKIALQKAKNADVKAFAKMMVNDHGASMREGKALAEKEKIAPSPSPADTTAQEIATGTERLNSTQEGQFDAVYMDMMATGHQMAVEELTAMQNEAVSPALKAFIEKILPKVREHLKRALEIQSKLANPPA